MIKNYQNTLKELGISYLGNVSQSMKMKLSETNGTLTYCIYIAPATMAREALNDNSIGNVCPCSQHCKQFCLNGSGRNKGDIISRSIYGSKINQARIKKTALFYKNRQLFVELVIKEINRYKKKAEKKNLQFAVRLNGTSDLSPEDFIDANTNKNLLEIFSDVQFYDYTKVPSRLNLTKKYKNYYVVLSYTGFNDTTALKWLKNGENVAVVFSNDKQIPRTFWGYPVVDGNLYDMRYLDPKGCVVCLHYHRTANDYKTGTYVAPDTPFVVKDNDARVVW